MIKRVLKDNVIWLKCNNFLEASEYIKLYLSNGYHFIDPIEQVVLLKKEETIAVSFLEYYTDIETLDDFKTYIETSELMLPDYNNTFLNVIGTIKAHYGSKNLYNNEPLINLDGIKHTVILLIDGLGTKFIKKLDDKLSFLNKHYKKSLTAIYQSTTAAATTAIKNGLTPIETAWLGWENYFSEIDKSVVMFSSLDYLTNEKLDFNTYDYIPYKPFFHDLKIKGYFIEPDFSKPDREIFNELDRTLEVVNKEEINVTYTYHTNPDHLFHVFGTENKAALKSIINIDKAVSNFANQLKKDTLLIITADHGHKDAYTIDIYKDNLLNEMLERNPQNEGRCTFFKVKEEFKEKFSSYFKQMFKNNFNLYTKEEIINNNFLGLNVAHSRSLDFIGDFVSIAKNNFVFSYNGQNAHFLSHHAGITKDEMEVPLIIYRGEK